MTIDGVKCDRGIIDACETAVKAKGDGRVSKEDAEKVFAKAADGFKVTRCARWTLRYCLAHFKWTEAAVTYLAEQMKAATQEDEPTKPQSHPQTHKVTKPHTQKPINPQITHSETYKLTKLSSNKSRLSAENRPSRKRGARNVPTQAAEAQKPLQHARPTRR